MVFKFNSAKAVSYANNYSSKHNPFYKKFLEGEDCNFVSQCLFAGSENVSDKQNGGWFYDSEKEFSSSWINPKELFCHLLSAQKGPFGRIINENNLSVGDIVFKFGDSENEVGIVTKIVNNDIFFVVKNKNFEEKKLKKDANLDAKYLHILGVKK